MTTAKALSVGVAERDVADQITRVDAEILGLRRRLNLAALDRDDVDGIQMRLASLRELRDELGTAISEARQRDVAAENDRRLDAARRQYYACIVLWLREHRAVVLRLESLLADANRKERMFLDRRSDIHSTLREDLIQSGAELELPLGDMNDGGSDPAGDARRFQQLIDEIDEKWAARDDGVASSNSVEAG